MNKITLHTAPVNGGPFNCLPARDIELTPERILANDVILPWERHPHGMKLWIIGNEFGALGAVWANHEQDAFDELIDSDLGGGLLIDEADADEETARLGNAGEPCDLTHAWIQAVAFDQSRDCQLLCRFAEARGQGSKTLDF